MCPTTWSIIPAMVRLYKFYSFRTLASSSQCPEKITLLHRFIQLIIKQSFSKSFFVIAVIYRPSTFSWNRYISSRNELCRKALKVLLVGDISIAKLQYGQAGMLPANDLFLTFLDLPFLSYHPRKDHWTKNILVALPAVWQSFAL